MENEELSNKESGDNRKWKKIYFGVVAFLVLQIIFYYLFRKYFE